jgi:hypothetical protein
LGRRIPGGTGSKSAREAEQAALEAEERFAETE